MSHKFPVYLLALIMLTACSSDSNENKESGTEKVTKEIAHKAVAAIQDPLDKARKAAETVEQHNLQMNEGAQDMEKQ